ncbi:hypothetical protein [Prosthecobacter sp.]|uniref:hypothetical protein n=1 Tax=Prosthecobacter sp. TaxID=1965333 RepID=UPI001D3CFCCA|nr:hypothetical protein [Prosthecobacter sp.]MCB1279549.1 hypothetical protein [Prosthecobacter sp.]
MKTNHRPFFLILLLSMCGASAQAGADSKATDGEKSGVTKSAGWYFMGDKARPLASLEALPAKVQEKLLKHLKARLGQEFYPLLKFSSGRLADAEEMRRTNSAKDASDFRMYDVQFTWSLPDSGIESYVAQIGLREDGSVFEEIDLPAFATKKGALPLVPMKKAKEVAKQHGFAKTPFETSMSYDRQTGSLLWRFSRPVGENEFFVFDPAPRTGGMHFYTLDISAHDGSVVHQHLSRAIN